MADASFLQATDKEILRHIKYVSKHFSAGMIYIFALKMRHLQFEFHLELIKSYCPVNICFKKVLTHL